MTISIHWSTASGMEPLHEKFNMRQPEAFDNDDIPEIQRAGP